MILTIINLAEFFVGIRNNIITQKNTILDSAKKTRKYKTPKTRLTRSSIQFYNVEVLLASITVTDQTRVRMSRSWLYMTSSLLNST